MIDIKWVITFLSTNDFGVVPFFQYPVSLKIWHLAIRILSFMEGVKHPAEDYYEVQFYDIDQLNTLLQVPKDSPVYTEILLASFPELRRGKVVKSLLSILFCVISFI